MGSGVQQGMEHNWRRNKRRQPSVGGGALWEVEGNQRQDKEREYGTIGVQKNKIWNMAV